MPAGRRCTLVGLFASRQKPSVSASAVQLGAVAFLALHRPGCPKSRCSPCRRLRGHRAVLTQRTADEKDARAAEKKQPPRSKAREKLAQHSSRHPLARRAAHTRGREGLSERGDVKSTKAVVRGSPKALAKETLASRLYAGQSRRMNRRRGRKVGARYRLIVFVESGQVSRKPGLSRPEQQVRYPGTVVGYTSSSETRRTKVQLTDPWDETDARPSKSSRSDRLISLGHASRS